MWFIIYFLYGFMFFFFLKEKEAKTLQVYRWFKKDGISRLQEPARTNKFARPARWRLRDASLVLGVRSHVRMGFLKIHICTLYPNADSSAVAFARSRKNTCRGGGGIQLGFDEQQAWSSGKTLVASLLVLFSLSKRENEHLNKLF